MKTPKIISAYKGFLKENQLETVSIIQETSYTLEKALNSYNLQSKHVFSTSSLHNHIKTSQKFQEVNKALIILRSNQEFQALPTLNLRFQFRTGDIFPGLTNFASVFNEGEEVSIHHQPGEVLIVQIWATWCGYCQPPMGTNQKILEKHNEDWKGKVRIFGIGIDEKKEDLKERVNEKNWHKVIHLWNNEKNEELRPLSGDGVPFMLIVNRGGRIAFAGNPLSINVEETIQNLLKEQMMEDTYRSLKQVLKKELPKLLTDENMGENKIVMNFSWNKSKVFEAGKEKEEITYGEPKMVLKYGPKDKLFASKIVSLLSKFMPIKEIFDDPKGASQKCSNFLRKNLQEIDFDNIEIIFMKEYKLIFDCDVIEKSHQYFKSKGRVPFEKKEKIQQFNLAKSEFLEKNESYKPFLENFSLKCALENGDNFVTFTADDLKNEESTTLTPINHQSGEILLIYFWATWFPISFNLIKKFETILAENEEDWKGKVRLMTVSFDNDRNAALEVVKNANLKHVHNYFNKSGKDSIDKQFDRISIPNIVIFDPNGVLIYIGHLQNIPPLNKLIPTILSRKVVLDKEIEFIEENVYKAFKKHVKENGPQVLRKIKKNLEYKLDFDLVIKKELNLATFDAKHHKPSISFIMRTPEEALIKSLYPESIIPLEKITMDATVLKTVDLRFGESCSNCSMKLVKESPQYYCHACNVTFCPGCADKVDSTKKGSSSLIHPHNLAYINVKSEDCLKYIDEYKLGKNITFDEEVQIYGCMCNGCSKNFHGEYRWICLSCRPGAQKEGGFVDLCTACFWKMMKDDDKIVLGNLAEEKHIHGQHIWLRICFGDDYYEF